MARVVHLYSFIERLVIPLGHLAAVKLGIRTVEAVIRSAVVNDIAKCGR